MDLVFRRYNAPEAVLSLPASDFYALVTYAAEQTVDEKLFQRWIPQAQAVMGFDEFKASIIPPPEKSEKEIMDDVNKILEAQFLRSQHGDI